MPAACPTRIVAYRGTPSFAAPEVCRRLHQVSSEGLTQRLDIWSLGVTLFELWMGHSPWARLITDGTGSGTRFDHHITWTVGELRGDIPPPGVNSCWDALTTKHDVVTYIIRRCCHPAAEKRPTARQLIGLVEDKLRTIEFELAHEFANSM